MVLEELGVNDQKGYHRSEEAMVYVSVRFASVSTWTGGRMVGKGSPDFVWLFKESCTFRRMWYQQTMHLG